MSSKKKRKTTGYKQELAQLASRKEFKIFRNLLDIEEKNIIVKAFKINPGDETIREKKAHFDGQVYQLRKIKKTFEEALKKTKKDEEKE